MKKTLEILEAEDKSTKAGKKYMRFKTNEGWLSCFDTKVSDELKKLVGNTAEIEVETKDNFSNITAFIAAGGKVSKFDNFPASMKVSFVKDVYCAICTRISQAVFDGMNEEQRLGLMELSLKAIDKAIEHYK